MPPGTFVFGDGSSVQPPATQASPPQEPLTVPQAERRAQSPHTKDPSVAGRVNDGTQGVGSSQATPLKFDFSSGGQSGRLVQLPVKTTQPGPDGGGPGYRALVGWLVRRLSRLPITTWKSPSNVGPRVNPGREPSAGRPAPRPLGSVIAVSPNDAPRYRYGRGFSGRPGVVDALQQIIDLARPPPPGPRG